MNGTLFVNRVLADLIILNEATQDRVAPKSNDRYPYGRGQLAHRCREEQAT